MHSKLSGMQKSPSRHPLAVLRLFLKLGQKEMADLIGCSASAIQAIELKQVKKMRFTEELAERVVKQTSVNFDWLLEGDPEARMTNAQGIDYTIRDYEKAQGKAAWEKDEQWLKEVPDFAKIFSDDYYNRIFAILSASLKTGRYQWACWKMHSVFCTLEKEFNLPVRTSSFARSAEEKQETVVVASPKPARKKATKKPQKKK
jgi:transcriptional regulator with XRE-family HTH domain